MRATLLTVMLSLTALTGCFSVDVVSSPILGEDIDSHVVVSNYGWALFGCIPLVCGNENADSWCPFTFFKNEIKPSLAYDKLVSLAEQRRCELTDVHFLSDNDVLFDAWYAPVPWVLVYKETNLSANLKRSTGGLK